MRASGSFPANARSCCDPSRLLSLKAISFRSWTAYRRRTASSPRAPCLSIARAAREPHMNSVIAFALKQRILVLLLFFATLVGGVIAFQQLNIEAYPDPTPP